MKKSGADTLRLIVRNMDNCRESFNDMFTLDELVQIGKAFLECGYDICPDRWHPRQIAEALKGIVPKWDDDNEEKPIFTGKV